MSSFLEIKKLLLNGMVIPAHPLAVTRERKFDERKQRALTRYYLDAGAGGIAIGVHTTQFEIHNQKVGLYKPVLELTSKTIKEYEARTGKRIIMIAGVIGKTEQAIHEATTARDLDFHCALLSLSAFGDASNDEMIQHCKRVAEVIPLFGFYLQSSVGGRILDYNFWRKFVEIENVVAIKIAPFDRYRTLDVIRAVADAKRQDKIALYTGNDDNIVNDLITQYVFDDKKIRIVGGLLGQWAVWTKRAVELLDEIKTVMNSGEPIPHSIITKGIQITDCNSAIFDAGNNFTGCISGIHEILRRQGLLEGVWTLNHNENLSPGQKEEIDRIYSAYPHLNDDEFVKEHLDEWMK